MAPILALILLTGCCIKDHEITDASYDTVFADSKSQDEYALKQHLRDRERGDNFAF